ncbi:MAG: hypothetical protein DME16_12710 [Candidatus Rokuibacteriota bacterium]|nr:MAG: hypothetical protein DME16_12710 [Candidatus Rokubacteria bacterium]
MRRHLRMVVIMGIALFTGLPAAPSREAEAQPKRGGTLVMLVQPEPPTLASYLSTSGPIGQVTAKVYDGLLEYDFNLNPVASLAESWQAGADGKSITFKLRRGVRFHDGKPFTSADVKFSVMEVLKKVHPRGANTFRALIDIETPDETTAVFKLDQPAPYILRALSGYESPMLPKHLFEGQDPKSASNANKPVGTGPFKFVEWDKGQFIRLDRNDQYWKPAQPYLDRIVARFIPDPSTRAAAMEKGEVHFAAFDAIPFVDVNRLKALPHIAITLEGYSMVNPITLLEMNSKHPPLDKKEVRQAIAYAVDRKFIIENIWFGFGRPATGPLNQAGPWPSGHRRHPAPRGRAHLAQAHLHELRLRPDLGLLLQPGRSRPGRAPAVPDGSDPPGHGLREQHALLEPEGGRSAEVGDDRVQPRQARRALQGVPEDRGRGQPHRLALRHAVRQHVQQPLPGHHHEPARRLRQLRPGLAEAVAGC